MTISRGIGYLLLGVLLLIWGIVRGAWWLVLASVRGLISVGEHAANARASVTHPRCPVCNPKCMLDGETVVICHDHPRR